MGSTSLADMLELSDRDNALRWHLRSNCYPPVPSSMFPIARDAIVACIDGKYDTALRLPDGVTTQGGYTTCSASFVVRALHLELFVSHEEE